MTAPATLSLSTDGKRYISNCNRDESGKFKEDGIFNIQASLKNVSNNTDYNEVVVAVYASEGITPLNEHQQKLSYEKPAMPDLLPVLTWTLKREQTLTYRFILRRMWIPLPATEK